MISKPDSGILSDTALTWKTVKSPVQFSKLCLPYGLLLCKNYTFRRYPRINLWNKISDKAIKVYRVNNDYYPQSTGTGLCIQPVHLLSFSKSIAIYFHSLPLLPPPPPFFFLFLFLSHNAMTLIMVAKRLGSKFKLLRLPLPLSQAKWLFHEDCNAAAKKDVRGRDSFIISLAIIFTWGYSNFTLLGSHVLNFYEHTQFIHLFKEFLFAKQNCQLGGMLSSLQLLS